MLQFLNRYNVVKYNKNITSVLFVKNNKKKYTKYLHVYPYAKSVICGVAIFFRKSFFRSTLLYVNFQYSNLNYTPDFNMFYHPKIVLTYVIAKHNSFLTKKRFTK